MANLTCYKDVPKSRSCFPFDGAILEREPLEGKADASAGRAPAQAANRLFLENLMVPKGNENETQRKNVWKKFATATATATLQACAAVVVERTTKLASEQDQAPASSRMLNGGAAVQVSQHLYGRVSFGARVPKESMVAGRSNSTSGHFSAVHVQVQIV